MGEHHHAGAEPFRARGRPGLHGTTRLGVAGLVAASLFLAACGGVMTPAATFDPDYEVRWYESQNAAGPELDPRWDGNGWPYVADEVSQGVTVVDLATGEPVQFIRTEGGVPHHPYITKDQRWVLVTIRYGDWVAPGDVGRRQVRGRRQYPG